MEALRELTASVETNLSDDRLAGLLAAERDVNRRKFRRLNAILFVGLAGLYLQAAANHNQGRDIKSLVTYVKDCQDPNGQCAKQSQAKLGGAVVAVAGKVYDATACLQMIPLEQRTEAKARECRARFIG